MSIKILLFPFHRFWSPPQDGSLLHLIRCKMYVYLYIQCMWYVEQKIFFSQWIYSNNDVMLWMRGDDINNLWSVIKNATDQSYEVM